jgi:hypothetical protein
MLDSKLRFKFWVIAGIYAFLGLLLTGLSAYYFLEIKKNPIAFFVVISIIIGYSMGYVWCCGDYFRSIFGYYPWRKKALSNEGKYHLVCDD